MAQGQRGIVLTGQQDKPNAGYSGTPLWRLHAERDARMQQEAESAAVKIPDGFTKCEEGWYFSEKSQLYWREEDHGFYVLDPMAQQRVRLHEAKTYEIGLCVGGVCHERASQVRHVLVRDLVRAAQALRMSIEHLDQPCALHALYDGHRAAAAGNACAEFCAKHLHTKLLPKLAAFRGYWSDDRLRAVVRASFEELDEAFAERHPGIPDGCSAAIALVLGNRLIVASIGDVACVVALRNGETLPLARAHAVPDPDAEDDDEDDEADAEEGAVVAESGDAAEAAGAASGAAPSIPWTRALGDQDIKRAVSSGEPSTLLATPDVVVLELEHKHLGFALVCRSLYQSIGRAMAVSTVFRRCGGRPRMAAGALVDAAVQWLGQVGNDCSLASVVTFIDKVGRDDALPAAKRLRKDNAAQIRLRHILLKHRDCKATVDKVRNKQVKRTRSEAERILRSVLEECASDPGWKIFSQRCRELSECQSCLRAADLVGDLGWMKRGQDRLKLGEAFETAIFSLQVNQLSDLMDSDMGVHIVLRSA
eukprot:NODE_2334_length_2233_cov_9.581197.p1 GENE.NODE_2334_length_2233_cov_9.581197~~NODE_2334_length_2233_cov_9.581197.p1  ORF type:complete len:600 (-),score=177.33 NODE_2334_length_2233_cov_9.581197:434-2038(-)